jgi:hypothetical protein
MTNAVTIANIERAALPISRPFVTGPWDGPPQETYRDLHLEMKMTTRRSRIRHGAFRMQAQAKGLGGGACFSN